MRRGRRIQSSLEKEFTIRNRDYHTLNNPLPITKAFSESTIEDIHHTSLKVLEDLGIKVLLQEAREVSQKWGAIVDHDTMMVRIGREIIEEALANSPKSFMFVQDQEKRIFSWKWDV